MPLDFRCFSDLTVVSNSRYLACSLFFSGSRFSFNGDVALHSRVQFSFSSIARASHRQVPCIAHATLLPPSSPCCVSFPFFVAYVARLFGNIQAEEGKESSQRLNFLTVHPTYPRSYLPGFLARFLGFVHTSVVCFDPPVRSQFVSNVREMHAIGVELKLSHKLFFSFCLKDSLVQSVYSVLFSLSRQLFPWYGSLSLAVRFLTLSGPFAGTDSMWSNNKYKRSLKTVAYHD